ncbi:MAG TPA: PspA/IM30 family protein, partial [Vicinamibacteria bacterium]|nr:PspA/IM30 family protein [Vicinamibacteria bacterium]
MFTRIGRFFKAIFNAILGEAEAQVPLSMLEQSVREMLDNLRSLREATATTIAFETKAKRELDAQNARVRNLDKQAEEGLRQGNEKLARRALQLQAEAKGTRERADQTHKAAKLRADNARAKLTIEEERVQGKIRQLGELKAIHQMNEAQRRMQAITDEYNIDGAVNVFDKTAGTIQEQADKLSAMDTIAVSEGEE